MEKIRLRILSAREAISNWTFIAPWILQAVGEGVDESDVAYIQQQLAHSMAQAWLVYEEDKLVAVLVTETGIYGGARTLILRWLSGTARENWLYLLDYVEDWAAKNQYDRIEAWGRKGFEKILRANGYRHEFTVVGKSLSKRMH